ncbi:MAG: ABC transporter ATP-binding protein [Planctomycetota bacterium]|jgi:phospholipid/cholesterol/gamma-HCH transport system ATP-binding protein
MALASYGCVAGGRSEGRARPVEIRVEDLYKQLGGQRVLSGVTLEIRQGEIVALVGGSGCGKTVLLNHMIGQLAPDQGRVLVANHELAGAPLIDLATTDEEEMDLIRTHWAVVFQRNALFSGTVYENIALWLREVKNLGEPQIRQRARAAAEAVGLDADTILEKERDELSGGMAKRVAVARALAMEPLHMFYDEPTTGLDPDHAAQIHSLICTTHRDHRTNGVARTTLVITHDKDLLYRLRPRIVMLYEGRVFFEGPYERFEESASPVVRPYFDRMPVLHGRVRAS